MGYEKGVRGMTTADSWNRIRDKERIETTLNLSEEGNETTKFYSPKGTLLAVGYERIVYGDHGPYIELDPKRIQVEAWTVKKMKSPLAYYQELWPKDGSNVMLYVQKRTVANLPNPPKGRWSVWNNRAKGYADYKIGMTYLDPEKIRLEEICSH